MENNNNGEIYNDIITLTDEDGSEVEFQLLDIVSYNGDDYAVLLPFDDDDASDEAVILLIKSTDNDEENELIGIDDDKILDAVFELYLQREAERAQE